MFFTDGVVRREAQRRATFFPQNELVVLVVVVVLGQCTGHKYISWKTT